MQCKPPTRRHSQRFALVVILGAFFLTTASIPGNAAPSGAGTTGGAGGGGGGAGPGASSPAGGAAAPAQPYAFGFPTFFIIADGAEPNFQIYSTELIARDLVNAFLPKDQGPKAASSHRAVLPFVILAASGWGVDTLDQACQNDPSSFAGALVVKFTSFYTDANWILFNSETQHVQPSFFFAGCRDMGKRDGQGNEIYNLVYLTPEVRVHTVKSSAQVTFPISYLTALASLFTFRGSSTAAYQVRYGILLLTTAVGGLSGPVGAYNPGHEALSAGYKVSHVAVALTSRLCSLDSYVQPKLDSYGQDYESALQSAWPPIESIQPGVISTPVPTPQPLAVTTTETKTVEPPNPGQKTRTTTAIETSPPLALRRTPPATIGELCDQIQVFAHGLNPAIPTPAPTQR